MRRRPAGSLAVLLILALAAILFLTGWCAAAATRPVKVSDQAKSWLILALILVGALTIRWGWKALCRAVSRRFHNH